MAFEIHPSFELLHHGQPIDGEKLAITFPSVSEFLDRWDDASNTLEIHTSGSTGKPKAVLIDKWIMWHSAGTTIEALKIAYGAKALLALSPEYIAGKMMLVRAMRGGWKLHIEEPSSDVLERVNERFDFTALVPLQVRGREERLMHFDSIIIGGAPMSIDLEMRLSKLPVHVYATYGMTETVSHIALREIAPKYSDSFKAVPGVEFTKGKEGQLIISAPAWKQDELETTDVVELLDSSTFKWKGRLDFVINSGGVKIHPEEIEPIIAQVIGQEAYIGGVTDPTLGSKVVGFTEKEVGESDIEILRDRLPKYALPKEWRVVDTFPRTANGKILRRKLR